MRTQFCFPKGVFVPAEGRLFRRNADEGAAGELGLFDVLDPVCDVVAGKPPRLDEKWPPERPGPAERPEGDLPPKDLETAWPELERPEGSPAADLIGCTLVLTALPAWPVGVAAGMAFPEARGNGEVDSRDSEGVFVSEGIPPTFAPRVPSVDPSLQIPFDPLPPVAPKLARPATQLDPPLPDLPPPADPFDPPIEGECSTGAPV